MKRRWLIYLAFGFVFYLVFLVVYVPASWLAWGLARSTNGVVHLDQPTGSVWHGAGKLTIFYPQMTSHELGQTKWNINPLWLVTGQLQVHIQSAAGPTQLQGTMRFGRNSVHLSDLNLSLPAERVSVFYPPAALANPQGKLILRARELDITASAVEGGAELLWQNAASTLSPVKPLGEYRLELTGQKKTANLKLTTVRGDLELTGQGQWQMLDNGALQFKGSAVPRGQASELEPLLQLLSDSQVNGTRPLVLNTVLAFPKPPVF